MSLGNALIAALINARDLYLYPSRPLGTPPVRHRGMVGNRLRGMVGNRLRAARRMEKPVLLRNPGNLYKHASRT